MGTDDWRTEAKALAADAMLRFFIADAATVRSGILAAAKALPPGLTGLASAFEHNVSAVVSTVGVPLTLASAAAEQSHWQRLHAAERIRTLKLEPEPGESEESFASRKEANAFSRADQRMREFTTSADGRDILAADACQFLLRTLKYGGLGDAADELLRQGAVLTWSALEILSRDLFEALLNAKPQRALKVLQDPAAKHRLQSRFTLEELAVSGFDLSTTLGSLLSSQQDFSDVRTIKAVMFPLLDSERTVVTTLEEKALWLLCQQRHLIVHRRGVVDARYLEATGDNRNVGDQLVITPADLESQLDKVVEAGLALLSAAGGLTS